MEGEVFYSIRKEYRLNHNIKEDKTEGCCLRACLKQKPTQEVFIDFHDHTPSSEPAAFFVEPFKVDGQQIGWLVLQCAINKVNSIFAWTQELGPTGETFLVNQEGFMLTESNFEGSSTILKKHLDDRNIQAKFVDKQGHRVVKDYRGFTAQTSFKVVEFLGTFWLVVAKKDVDAVISEHYQQHRRYYAERLLDELRTFPLLEDPNSKTSSSAELLRIDMDEFLKASHGERLHTFGLSTCTGLLAFYPGRFAYMAHISPKDRLYGDNDTNLLGQITKKIKSFDVYPCELRQLKFVVVSTHQNTQLAIIDKLVEEGFLLSQIQILTNTQATSAAMEYSYAQDSLKVTWRQADNQQVYIHPSTHKSSHVGGVIQKIMQENQIVTQDNPIIHSINL